MSEEISINVATEQRFWAYKGTLFANAMGGNAFWLRYLDVYSWVRLIARIEQIESLPKTAVPLMDKRIRYAMLPSYHEPAGIIRKLSVLWSHTKTISVDNAAFILTHTWSDGLFSLPAFTGATMATCG